MAEEPEFGLREGGGIGRAADERLVRVALSEQHVANTDEPTLRDLSKALIAVDGTDYGLRSASWISRFTDMSRQAVSYREGRVLLAGDAAHVHPPQGGQGLNTGVQDAVNLGWKLAQVIGGTSPDSLLDTYHAERHPVGARVLHNTMAQVALQSPGDRHQALRDTMTELLSMDEPRKRIAGMLSGLDIHYDLGEGHPLLGRRMPDLDLVTADGPCGCSPCCTTLGPSSSTSADPDGLDITPWADRVKAIEADHAADWELPVLGPGPGPRGRADQTRRTCRLGWRGHRHRAPRRTHHVVRTAMMGQLSSPASSACQPARPSHHWRSGTQRDGIGPGGLCGNATQPRAAKEDMSVASRPSSETV